MSALPGAGGDGDLEITRLCAEAMGIELTTFDDGLYWDVEGGTVIYDPLRDKAQAFDLVERFKMTVSAWEQGWQVTIGLADVPGHYTAHHDLSRAICLCVARLEGAKERT